MDERRYYGLDALRGGMMLLGIVLHSAIFYLAAPPFMMGPLTDRNTSYLFDGLFHFIHSFRMPAFFLLSGFFTALLVERRGTWGTYKNRGARVVAPLLVGVITILPVTLLFMVDMMVSVRFGTHAILPERVQVRTLGDELRAAGFPEEPGVGHLWFLYYLCWFYLLIPGCGWLGRASLRVGAPIRRLLDSPASLIVLSLITAATLWPFRGGQVLEGIFTLGPHPPTLLYYGSFFVFGYVLHTHREALKSYVRFLPWTAAVAALLFPLSLYLTHLEGAAPSGAVAPHLAAVIVHGLCTWAIIYMFMGATLRFFDHESPWTLYVSQSAYWVYLAHMPAASFAAWMLVPYDLPAIVKFAGVMSFTVLTCFVSYHYAVQRTWVSRFLNGKRFDLDWPWRRPPLVPAADGKAVR